MRKLTVSALLLAILGGSTALILARQPEDIIEDILACSRIWVQQITEADNTFNGNYGTAPNWDVWRNEMQQANDNYVACITSAASANAVTTRFTFAQGASLPSSVIYRFDNGFPAGEQVYLTVWNGDGANVSFDNATIQLNGVTVVAAAELAAATDLEKPVTLLPGQNELRFDADPAQLGNLVAVLDTHRFSPPN
ncbi:MAG: hypothetical protein D6738_00460 [Acidobacteria bacterium]|nr:MAG: hypothetical protein D6738_00460 [Acidobacteriota bacterium]